MVTHLLDLPCDHFIMYENIKSLGSTPKASIILYIIYISIFKLVVTIFAWDFWPRQGTYCLIVSCLARVPLPDPLAGEGRFWWTFCVCTVSISELLVSPFLKWDTKGKERAQEIITSHSLDLEVPRQSAFLTSFSFTCFIYKAQEFQLYLTSRIGKSMCIPFSQKWKSVVYI